MPSRLGNIITEIDAHLSDPSCSRPYGRVRMRVRSFVWHPPPPPPPSTPRERVIDLLDTRYVGYRYGCYRRSRVRDTTRTPACRCHSHPWQIRMAHLTLWNARHPLTLWTTPVKPSSTCSLWQNYRQSCEIGAAIHSVLADFFTQIIDAWKYIVKDLLTFSSNRVFTNAFTS